MSQVAQHALDSVPGNSLEITQQAVAESLGFRRATVNQICTTLQDKGVMDYSRGSVVVRDRPALEAQACECYGRIRRLSLAAAPPPIAARPFVAS